MIGEVVENLYSLRAKLNKCVVGTGNGIDLGLVEPPVELEITFHRPLPAE